MFATLISSTHNQYGKGRNSKPGFINPSLLFTSYRVIIECTGHYGYSEYRYSNVLYPCKDATVHWPQRFLYVVAEWHIQRCLPALKLTFWVRKLLLTFKPLNAELNLICHLLALFGANHILHVSRIRVKTVASVMKLPDITHQFLHILLNTIMLMTRCKCYLNYNAHTCDMGPNVIQQKKWLFMYFTWDKRHPHLCSKVHHEGRQVDQTNE